MFDSALHVVIQSEEIPKSEHFDEGEDNERKGDREHKRYILRSFFFLAVEWVEVR